MTRLAASILSWLCIVGGCALLGLAVYAATGGAL